MKRMFYVPGCVLLVLLSSISVSAAPHDAPSKATTSKETEPTKFSEETKTAEVGRPVDLSRPEVAIDNAISVPPPEVRRKIDPHNMTLADKEIADKNIKVADGRKTAVPADVIEKSYVADKKKSKHRKHHRKHYRPHRKHVEKQNEHNVDDNQ